MESLRLSNNNVLASNILFGGLLFILVVTVVHSSAFFQQSVTAGTIVLSSMETYSMPYGLGNDE